MHSFPISLLVLSLLMPRIGNAQSVRRAVAESTAHNATPAAEKGVSCDSAAGGQVLEQAGIDTNAVKSVSAEAVLPGSR